MAIFSKQSMANLSTCHPDLQVLAYEVIKRFDFVCTCGHRGQADQDKAFEEGKTKLKYPHGNHNAFPSNAMDLYPFPAEMKNISRFYWFAGYVMGIAEGLYNEGKIDHKIRYGGDWDGDMDIDDQTFKDLVHFEILPR